MKKRRLILVAAMVILLFSASANAFSFKGIATGEWVNVVSTDSSDLYSVANNDAGGAATFEWGSNRYWNGYQWIYSGTDFNNQFSFNGVGSDGSPGWIADSETAFLIGDFSYRNGSTYFSSGIEGVELAISLTITDPIYSDESYSFDFSITNTPNNTGDPVLDGDIVTVGGLFSGTSFTLNDQKYTLELLGFSTDGGLTITTDFSSPEGETATAGLFARITSAPFENPVPEPATIFLLGAGFAAFAGLRRTTKYTKYTKKIAKNSKMMCDASFWIP
jgi:hypothetical protein